MQTDTKPLINLNDMSDNCKHLVNIYDILYVVPGDGCCGPNCAAAFLFHDEVFGPKLRVRMNKFMATHWNNRYKFNTQCSKDHPFVRKLGAGQKSFTDPQKLLKYLMHSKKAAYMWTDSEDLAVISDMYQIRIKVITSKGRDDKNPYISWIYPDASMKKFAELNNVDIDDMVLFHENDCHFNLVVNKNSDLALLGSLSFRYNIGPILANNDEDKVSEEEEPKNDIDDSDDSEVLDLRKELKICGDNKTKIEEEYFKCEKELRHKTEEVEKLKLEVKDLKEILSLQDQTKTNGVNEVEEESSVTEPENVWTKAKRKQSSKKCLQEKLNCKECNFQANTESQINSHVILKHPKHRGNDYNCNDCDYQGNSKLQLNKHINVKHTVRGQSAESMIKCKNCDEHFVEKWKLMKHRKLMHIDTVAPCKNENSGACSFPAEVCWWRHDVKSGEENIKCFLCNETFKSKALMMIHRKLSHVSAVRICNKYNQNKCYFPNNTCWYLHEEEMETDESDAKDNENEEEENNTDSESGFQKVFVNLKPPILKQRKKQKID